MRKHFADNPPEWSKDLIKEEVEKEVRPDDEIRSQSAFHRELNIWPGTSSHLQ